MELYYMYTRTRTTGLPYIVHFTGAKYLYNHRCTTPLNITSGTQATAKTINLSVHCIGLGI